jgi:hypothetical protein
MSGVMFRPKPMSGVTFLTKIPPLDPSHGLSIPGTPLSPPSVVLLRENTPAPTLPPAEPIAEDLKCCKPGDETRTFSAEASAGSKSSSHACNTGETTNTYKVIQRQCVPRFGRTDRRQCPRLLWRAPANSCPRRHTRLRK